jgi:hypothetical protein
VSQALTPPFMLAGVVLCLAGIAKLRSAVPAARAARDAGLPGEPWAVRALALFELAVGAVVLAAPGRLAAGACASLFAFFAAVALRLVRRSAGCGCFGESDAPTSFVQVFISAGFACMALASAVFVPHGVSWALTRPVAQWLVLGAALAGSAYCVVIAYTALPEAWSAWSGR